MKQIVTAKEGFYFNEETKKLEAYELIKAEFCLKVDEPTYYHCKLGGVDKVLKADHLVIFEDENCFKKGCAIPHSNPVPERIFFRVLPTGSGYKTWAFVDGIAKQIDASTIGLTYDGTNVSISSGEKYYSSKEEV